PALAEAMGPEFTPGFVRRPRLVNRLVEARNCSLAVIVAPAGYGKSTVLHEWAERDQRPFVWLRLDDSRSRATPSAISAAVEEIRSRHTSFVLVLDDADAVPGALVREGLGPLLKGLGQGSTLAVASRSEPSLPIGRRRAHRTLVELRMRDLAMTTAEAVTLLRRAGGGRGAPGGAAPRRPAAGWPAAAPPPA